VKAVGVPRELEQGVGQMDDIRRLEWSELPRFAEISAGAYPLFIPQPGGTLQAFTDDLKTRVDEDPRMGLWGFFRDGSMLGGMIFYDFRMNLFGNLAPVGGVGLVSVDLASRKQHIAREMIRFFLKHYDEHGAPLAALYPFRPDFYRKMGFGFGTPSYEHVIPPACLPSSEMRKFVRLAALEDTPAIAACYWGAFTGTHGLFEKHEQDFRRPLEKNRCRIAVFEAVGGIQGYASFGFEKVPSDNMVFQDVIVHDIVWNTREAFEGLLGFLHGLADQVRFVRIHLQDEEFVNILVDPRDSSGRIFPPVFHQSALQGIGIMYRILDLKWLFELTVGHHFGSESFTLTIDLEDSFVQEKSGSTIVRFEEGIPKVIPKARPGLKMSISVECLSSLVLGCVRFRNLYDYGLAGLSDAASVDVVDAAFRVPRRPICWTAF
jgi:predicted acetyltransferase